MKKTFKIVGITVLLLIIVIIGLILFNNFRIESSKNKTAQFIEKFNELSEDKVSYVIVEINPKAILEIINNKVANIGCLNEDCENVFDINVKGKKLSDAIETLYETAKNKGINVSNGVNISYTNSEIKNELKGLEYINYIKIDNAKENEIIDQVRNNEDIKNKTNELDYKNKLLEFYKNDKDYDSLYTCNIVNGELGCYITETFYESIPTEPSFSNIYTYNSNYQKLMNILDKFNIEYVSNDEDVEGFNLFKIIDIKKIKLGGMDYEVGFSFYSGDSENPNSNSINIIIESIKESGEYGYRFKTIPFNKINLITQEYNNSDIEEYVNYQSNVITGPGTIE